jgi:sialate O-acetylesterase
MAKRWISWAVVAVLACAVRAEVRPVSLFGDHAVLQRGIKIPVWGAASDGERVTVELAGQSATTVARDGRWRVDLEPLEPGGPLTMTIAGTNKIVLNDIMIGDVWICSGQSNMERQLGPRPPQKPIIGWEQAVAQADYPRIRQFYVPNRIAFEPQADCDGSWTICSPQTAADFCAVGFFFARDLYKAVDVPIGLLFTAWGGTVAEAWTSAASLETMPDFKDAVEAVQKMKPDRETVDDYAKRLAAWFTRYDPGSAEGLGWAAPDLDVSAWGQMDLPVNWEQASLPDFDGVVWFRKVIDVPASWSGKEAVLNLGPIDDQDTTWVNGVEVGSTDDWQAVRTYKVPASVLKAGQNVIAIRVLDTGGGGGLFGRPDQVTLEGSEGELSLAGSWSYKASAALADAPGVPRRPGSTPNIATVLYNGMIAPLQPYAIKGAIWYQGESNNDRPLQYQTLFPLMIADWRRAWGQGDFPFLFVQIAPYKDLSPEIREAQFLTLSKSPNTAMVVTTDVGDANDIHPANKVPVGARLALAARALAYGEKIEYSGPLYKGITIKGNRIVVSFTHTGSGLVAKGGALKGFVIAGADMQFVPAQARIVGDTVEVWSDAIAKPVAVRYGWANVPDVNLYNKEGLPASPFRSAGR